eukprot:TRINITY_DN28194_c0_g1_i1.p1 TRINITY_DN28194_c0_g1~~TRINITY_DN28194_c0_g1_i1.p1  ORF type:complete len:379 (-),score=82.40 TRINITY_DN28194_c0_g1_i1:95-1231(-)
MDDGQRRPQPTLPIAGGGVLRARPRPESEAAQASSTSTSASSAGSQPQAAQAGHEATGVGLFGPRGFGIYERFIQSQGEAGNDGTFVDRVRCSLSAMRKTWQQVTEDCIDEDCGIQKMGGACTSACPQGGDSSDSGAAGARTGESRDGPSQASRENDASPATAGTPAVWLDDRRSEPSPVQSGVSGQGSDGGRDRQLFGGGLSMQERREELIKEVFDLLVASPKGGPNLPGLALTAKAAVLRCASGGPKAAAAVMSPTFGLEVPDGSNITLPAFSDFMKTVLQRLTNGDELLMEVVLQQVIAEVRSGCAECSSVPSSERSGPEPKLWQRQQQLGPTLPAAATAAADSRVKVTASARLPDGSGSMRHAWRSAVLEPERA